MVHNPVVPFGQSKKFQSPYQKQMVKKTVKPPNTVELTAPDGSSSMTVHMARMKLAPPNLQSARYLKDLDAQAKAKGHSSDADEDNTPKQSEPENLRRSSRNPNRKVPSFSTSRGTTGTHLPKG